MEEILSSLDKGLTLLERLANSPSSLLVLVVISVLSIAIYKISRYAINYVLKRAAKFGHLEAIAVGHMCLHLKISPTEALKRIQQELDEL